MNELLAFLMIICGPQGLSETFGSGSNYVKKIFVKHCLKQHDCTMEVADNKFTFKCQLKKGNL